MAWTAKSDRFGAGSPTTAGGRIGPGQYYSNKGFEFEHGYAPFGSTNPRDTSKDGDCFGFSPPAPGTYDPKLPATYDPGLPRKHVPFAISASRFNPRQYRDDKPGPGDYKVDRDKGKTHECRTMGVIPSGPLVLRSSSAPSIPRGHQSFGYEELGNGRLVRQGPKDGMVFLSGRPQDSAGPGHYEPEVEAIAPRAVSGAFPKGPARIPLNKTSLETPGPGHYKSKQAIELEASPFRMGSSFASTSERGQTKKQAKESRDGPGPGTYAQFRPNKPDLRAVRAELQYFGSTVERFKSSGDRTAVPDSLGPGAYGQRSSIKIDPPNAKGFNSNTDRWKSEKENAVPGPGAYKAAVGITDESMSGPLASFSMLSNQGGLAFGSMSKRLSTVGKDNMPGPGDYALPSMSALESDVEDEEPRVRGRRPKRSKLPGAAFASKTPKDFVTSSSVREGLQKPPPGAYDPVSVKDVATVVRLRSKSEGFLSGSSRFPGHAPPKGYQASVGPGKYIPQEITGGKRLGTFNRTICEGMPEGGRPKGLGFETQDKRFKRDASAFGPGPGSYNTEPGWITKSHNCYFGDLT